MTRKNHVAGTDALRPMAATVSSVRSGFVMPSARSLIQSARSASGNDEASASANDTPKSAGSAWYARRSARHIDGRAGGRSWSRDGIEFLRVGLLVESRCLEVEHRAIAAAGRHELVVASELDH